MSFTSLLLTTLLKCSLFILMAMDLTPFTMATSVSFQRLSITHDESHSPLTYGGCNLSIACSRVKVLTMSILWAGKRDACSL